MSPFRYSFTKISRLRISIADETNIRNESFTKCICTSTNTHTNIYTHICTHTIINTYVWTQTLQIHP